MKTLTIKTTSREIIKESVSTAACWSDRERGALWAHRYALIDRQPFFKGLSPRQLELLTDVALEMQFEPGQQMLREGSPANRFFLILEGRVMLESKAAEDRNMVPIRKLGPGDDLGSSWLFPPVTLQFSAHAIEQTRAILFYWTRLQVQYEQDLDLRYELMKRTSEAMEKRLQATRCKLLGSASRLSSTSAPLLPRGQGQCEEESGRAGRLNTWDIAKN